ncbi:MAG: phage distal tail protein, Rcc01695 family [Pikeienuella sp.]
MAFHETVFPASLSFGSSGGPERRTEIITLASGFEERNTSWAHARRHYDAGIGLRHLDDLHELIAFFEARRGMLHGFRWKDWADCKSCAPSGVPSAFDQVIGTGDGSERRFDLTKHYTSGGETYVRPISKPVADSVVISVGGTVALSSDFTVDASTGAVVFATAPVAGAEIAAGYEFHVPVRFDTDRIEINLAAFEAGEVPSVPIVEVRV